MSKKRSGTIQCYTNYTISITVSIIIVIDIVIVYYINFLGKNAKRSIFFRAEKYT